MGLDLGAGIYGLITVGALVAAESARHETYLETEIAVALAALVVWLAHSYAEFASWRVREGRGLSPQEFGRTMVRELPILVGASIPAVAVFVAWLAGADLSSGITVGLWAVAAAIVAVEILAGVRAELSGRDLLLQSALGAVLGLLVLALRFVLH
jgi:hypothetical protein